MVMLPFGPSLDLAGPFAAPFALPPRCVTVHGALVDVQSCKRYRRFETLAPFPALLRPIVWYD
jgi:hypothetical protein